MVVLVYQGYRDTIDKFHGKFDTLEAAENHIYQDLVKGVQDFLDTMEQKKNGTYVSEHTKLTKQVKDLIIKDLGKEHYETSLKDAEKRDAEITEHALESLKYYENTDWKGGFKKVSQTPKPSIQQYPSKKMYEGYSQRYAESQGNYPYLVFDPSFVPSPTEMNAEGKEYTLLDGIREEFDVEFNEWADQERMSHGKDISFKDWAQDEGMKHGNTEITEWAQHEDESHDARYGAETFEAENEVAETMLNNLIKNVWNEFSMGARSMMERWLNADVREGEGSYYKEGMKIPGFSDLGWFEVDEKMGDYSYWADDEAYKMVKKYQDKLRMRYRNPSIKLQLSNEYENPRTRMTYYADRNYPMYMKISIGKDTVEKNAETFDDMKIKYDNRDRTFFIKSVDYDTDGEIENDKLPQEFTIKIPSDYHYFGENADERDITDVLNEWIITETGFSTKGIVWSEEENNSWRKNAEQPIRMSQEDLLDFFNSLKTNEEILVWYNSAVRSADDWIKMTVGRRSESKKYGVKKVALKGKNGGKFYLYNRKGRISLAMGDMATSLIAAKKSDAKGYGAEDGNEKSIKSAIKKLEKALSKTDGAKYKMHDLDISVQPTTIAGFEMSRNGKKYDGGSYLIMKDGSIINAAMGNAEYGNITDSFEAKSGKRMYCPNCKTNRTWNNGFKKRDNYSKGEKPRDFEFYVCQKCDYAYDPKTGKKMEDNWREMFGYDAETFGAESKKTKYGMIAAGVITAFAILSEIKKRF